MWGKKKRRTEKVDSLIGRHTTIQGNINFTGGLHVDGTVKGNVVSEGEAEEGASLSISNHGTVEGDIRVPFADINGVVLGNVHVTDHISLAAGARITGNIHYSMMEVAVGAQVNGKLLRMREEEEVSGLEAQDKEFSLESEAKGK